ncbi:MAG TPA: 2Fe-2S iron-sulfur cluster-binding protein [Anaerovoracaceae bacterium]|nr:2Fe-2S iron-sulfur cluster-binding protein [Anaerovoracaceae bacterium]
MLIRIDGREIEAFPGETILQAARREGIFIPSLCYSDATEPTNSCRLCMVEIIKGEKSQIVAACAFPTTDGLTVTTDTEQLGKLRASILKLMYAQAPENPVIIDLMKRYDVVPEKSYQEKEGQCILCGLCVQVCRKLGASAISTVHRGTTKKVSTPYDRQAAVCIGCASCAGFCPTKCIKVEDTEEGRTIWNKKFPWVKCEVCGKIVSTDKHYKASTGSDTVICPDCRKKAITDTFAETLGEE